MPRISRLFILLWLFSTAAHAELADVDALIAQDAQPPGVVFEIVSGDPDLLQQALPSVQQAIERLRAKYPAIPIAVVTHGDEQFALSNSEAAQEKEIHSLARSMTEEQGVPIHVCGTYASWRSMDPEDFPSYVDVAAARPAQINDYRALDYVLIRIGSDDF